MKAKTVVSITPVSLDADSRTLKEAASIARLGHRSIVVEGQGSATAREHVAIELVTLGTLGDTLAATDSGAVPGIGTARVESIARTLGRLLGPLYFLASWTASNLLITRRLPAADLYWLHGYEQWLAVALRRRPYVYDAHDVYFALPHDAGGAMNPERLTHAVRARIERLCVRRATRRVTTSAAMARILSERFGRPFTVLHNAQDPRIAQPSPTDVRAACGLNPDDFLLVMVGNDKPGTVLHEPPPGVHIALVGARYEQRDEPLPARVHRTGPIAPEQVGAFIATADAATLLYVPVNANSPAQLVNGLFHAVAAGLPLLYPEAMEAIAELAAAHDLGVAFDPASPAATAAAVTELRARMTELRASVAAAAPALSWEREESVLAGVLQQALA